MNTIIFQILDLDRYLDSFTVGTMGQGVTNWAGN